MFASKYWFVFYPVQQTRTLLVCRKETAHDICFKRKEKDDKGFVAATYTQHQKVKIMKFHNQ
jgi:hypothetical protein